MAAVALSSDNITKIGLIIIAALVLIGVLLSIVITALVARIVILVLVIGLAVLVWQQRTHLKDKFDQKAYHDFVLSQGLLPPELLKKAVMEEFVPAALRHP